MERQTDSHVRRAVRIVLALGTNIDQEANMRVAKEWLKNTFSDVRFSQAISTPPIGLEGSDDFLNCLAIGYTTQAVDKVQGVLKHIEHQCGRSLGASRQGLIAMDIDLLLYGEERFHEADWERDYIQQLWKELRINN